MSDILNEYGNDSRQPQVPRATNGGHPEVKPLPYSPPVGPKDQHHVGPGLAGGTNHGNCGSQHRG